MLPFFVPRYRTFCGIALAAFLWPRITYAEPCPLQVEPSEPQTNWHEKARDTQGIVAKISETQHDCRSIRIEVQPEGNALLTFTTTDGRIAVRLLHSPEDISPTIEALLVTLPVEKPLEIRSAAPNPKPANPVEEKKPAGPTPAKIIEISRLKPQVLIRTLAGMRLGIEGGVFAPAIALHATMHLDPWEIGFGGEWNPVYLLLSGSAPAGYAMRSFEGNFLFGRRFVSKKNALRVGVSLGGALVHEETDTDPATKQRVNVNALQPRVGAYGGLVIPREGQFRFILGFQGDVALWGMRENGTTTRGLPKLSRFGLGLSLGMEIAP